MVEQLVERIRQKDQRAMSLLYQMYIEELSSVCYRYVHYYKEHPWTPSLEFGIRLHLNK
jgi:RNA polymerase sigma-70 factor (ECF subfamily)